MNVGKLIRDLVPCRIYWPHWLFRKASMRWYKKHHGYSFDLDNPVTFTEKVLWYMCEYDGAEISNITDKVKFKFFIDAKLGGGKTIPLYGYWDNAARFTKDWDRLPKSFVLKSNMQGSGNCIKIIKDKDSYDITEISKLVRDWLKPKNTLLDDYTCRMYNSKPQVLAEKYMEEFDSHLNDYKFFCFNGEPYCMYVASEQFSTDGGEYPIAFYDLNWKRMEVSYGKHPVKDMSKPAHFEEMKEYARVLSKGFPFVRVDFFDTNEKLYLAELTFSPGGACFSYNPPSFNKDLGDRFIIK